MERRTPSKGVGGSGLKAKEAAPYVHGHSVKKRPSEQSEDNAKFKGVMLPPAPVEDDVPVSSSHVIDPSLLTMPLYVPPSHQSDGLKEQLGDITTKIYKTLFNFDDDELEPDQDPVLAVLKQHMGELEDNNVRAYMDRFMNKYEEMVDELSNANKDRDEMLLQLADWFTTDHVDLDDVKLSFSEADESGMRKGYVETMTLFEKLKTLEKRIHDLKSHGRPCATLNKQKQEIERTVVEKFKLLRSASIQSRKGATKDDSWKYAAQEIVDVLNSVRTENAEELEMIHKRMMDMLDQLDKQYVTIRSMTAELRDKREVIKRLTDENTELGKAKTNMQTKLKRYEKEMAETQKTLKQFQSKKLQEKDADKPPVSDPDLAPGPVFPTQAPEVSRGPRGSHSDTALLKVQLKECREELERVKAEFAKTKEAMEEFKIEVEEKKSYIVDVEKERDRLSKEVHKLRLEKKKKQTEAPPRSPAPPVPQVEDNGEHKCEHCKCHVTDSEWESKISALSDESMKWKSTFDESKKQLASTEQKLSAAQEQIKKLRRQADQRRPPAPSAPPTPQTPASTPTPTKPARTKPRRESLRETTTPKPPPPPTTTEIKADVERPKSAVKEHKLLAPKPRKDVKARYLQKSRHQLLQERSESMPPPQTDAGESDTVPDNHESRELKLYRAGDLQGKLNALVAEIMEFVSDIGRMIYTDKEDERGKVQGMKMFSFNQDGAGGRKGKDVGRDMGGDEARQRKSQAVFNGQNACSKLKETFDMLSNSLHLQHNDYEAIYRSFKLSQQRNLVRKDVLMGRLPASALKEFDRVQQQKIIEQYGNEHTLSKYLAITYGGGGGQPVGLPGRHQYTMPDPYTPGTKTDSQTMLIQQLYKGRD